MTGPKVLIVEDEPKVALFIKKGLEESSYEVTVAYNGLDGKTLALNDNFDIILIDICIPDFNGLLLCKEIRQHNSNIPILILTALSSTEDKLVGFESGADDYLVKPFEFKEMLARIKALLKRSRIVRSEDRKLKISDLEIDRDMKKVTRGGKLIELTAKEFYLLEYLVMNKGRIVSRAEIAERIWDLSFDTGTNVIDVYINFLRKKVDKGFDNKLIHTSIGMGYFLSDEE